MIYILGSVWATLLIRSVIKELHFYRMVKSLAPEIWQKMGYHFPLALPIIFVSKSGKTLLENTANNDVKQSYQAHRRAGRDFITFIGFALITAILFFKLA